MRSQQASFILSIVLFFCISFPIYSINKSSFNDINENVEHAGFYGSFFITSKKTKAVNKKMLDSLETRPYPHKSILNKDNVISVEVDRQMHPSLTPKKHTRGQSFTSVSSIIHSKQTPEKTPEPLPKFSFRDDV